MGLRRAFILRALLVFVPSIASLAQPSRDSSSLGPPSSYALTKLGVAVTSWNARGDLGLFVASEASQNADLDGDGDRLDTVPFVYEATSHQLRNLGFDAFLSDVSLGDGIVVFSVNESAHGDLNGDGDVLDSVAHVFDATSGTITNVGLAGSVVAQEGNLVLLRVSESGQAQTDLNGDGDAVDCVLHVYDHATGVVTNLGAACGNTGIPAVKGSRAIFAVAEAQQGNTDLNGDGRVSDQVVFVYDHSTGFVSNTGLASEDLWQLCGSRALIGVAEYLQGSIDRNGDGDAADHVLAIYDVSSHTTINTGYAIVGLNCSANAAAVVVSEFGQGSTDLNGDGDAVDYVLSVLPPSSTILINTQLTRGQGPVEVFLDDTRLALSVWERAAGNADLNGDGDTDDQVLHIFDLLTLTATNLGLDIGSEFDALVTTPTLAAFGVVESHQGNHALLTINDALTGAVSRCNRGEPSPSDV